MPARLLSLILALVALTVLPGGAAAAGSTIFTAGIPAGAQPNDIVAGPDGHLWFTAPGADGIGRITPGGSVTMFTDGIGAGAEPAAISAGPDGSLWFTEDGAERIGRITTAGVVTEFPLGVLAYDIAAGPDGRLWFTAPEAGLVGRISTSGDVTLVREGISADAAPLHIAAAPDGGVWFTDYAGDRVGRIGPGDEVTEFPVPGAGPLGLAAGPDGNTWFAAYDGHAAGRITPAGTTDLFPFAPGGRARGVIAGPDGRLWYLFGGTWPHRVGTDGREAAHIHLIGEHLDHPITALAVARDGTVWGTSPHDNGIIRIVPDPPPAPPTVVSRPVLTRPAPPALRLAEPTAVGTTTATLNAIVDSHGAPTSIDILLDWATRTMRYAMTVPAGATAPVAVDRTLTRLQPGRTYDYSLVARSAGGSAVVHGTFTTVAVPAISGLRVTPRSLRPGQRARIAFRAATAGVTRFALQRVSLGRRSGGRCVASATARARAGAPPCVRAARRLGTISRRVPAGVAAVRFGAALRGRPLRPGTYRLVASLRTPAGGVATALFTVGRR
ncbi:virginiamycin B lyase family protein [Miltoncostaea marina]|uniref:Vgb family protein n=1 Tax=Miltoncostaea marina TaxID=2843215 RepID=UPI001C3C8475|nr:hypothetical protein [Miltoncostaea marina]